jgi:hypothetical protein
MSTAIPVDWQMSVDERTFLQETARSIRPIRTVEVGCGASTFAFAEHSRRVISIDKSPPSAVRKDVPANVRLIRGRSRWWLAPALRLPGVQLVLIDGDHSRLGARDDVNAVLRARPSGERVLLMHDTANEECRAGITSADWEACAWVVDLELDAVAPDPGNGWGGMGIARLRG